MKLKSVTILREHLYEITDEGKIKQVIIRFKNNKFLEAIFPFKNFPYTREQWKILRGIEEEISWIELEMKDVSLGITQDKEDK